MRLYGVTGGIGAGKSAVADLLEEFCFPVVRADLIAREAVAHGELGRERLVETFGSEILDISGALDRRKLAALVFEDPARRSRLNTILHPLIHQRSAEAFRRLEAAGAQVVFYESPLLFEIGRDREMDGVVVVTAPRDQRIARVCARDGLSPREVEQRMAAQLEEDEKIRQADYVIENGGSLEELRERVAHFVRKLEGEGLATGP